jgi:photosystem II stability/assembly factor-like uncharacterized protein
VRLPRALLVGALLLESLVGCGTMSGSQPKVAVIRVMPWNTAAAPLPTPLVAWAMGPSQHGIAITGSSYTTDSTIWRTVDGGQSWHPLTTLTNDTVTTAWISPHRKTLWCVGVRDTPSPHDPQSVVTVLTYSLDGGKHWRVRDLQWNPQQINDGMASWIHLLWASPHSGWAVTLGGQVLHTANGGRTWSVVKFGHHALRGIQFVTPRVGWAWSRRPGTVTTVLWHTGNGGRSWTTRPIPGRVENMAWVSSSRGWLVGGRRLRSGAWQPVVWTTRDGGRRWQVHSLGPPTVSGQIAATVTVSSSSSWMWVTMGTNPDGWHTALWGSDDGGINWQPVTLPHNVAGITFGLGDNPHWFAGLPTTPASHRVLAVPGLYHWNAERHRWELITR